MKATQLLEQQHREVESLLGRLEQGPEDASAVLHEVARDMAAHMAVEQDIFYPLVVEANPGLVNESYEEHAVTELALKRLLATDPRDVTFVAKVQALRAVFGHHVRDEEHVLFPAVEASLGIDRLAKLGEELERAFADARGEGFEALVPPTFAMTSADEARKELAHAERPSEGRAHDASNAR